MMKRWTFWILLLPLMLISCGDRPSTTRSGLKTKNFQTIVDGKAVGLYVLSNKSGMEVCITNYGGRIVSIMVPDKKRKLQDVVLGFDSIGSYLHHVSDFGAVVGRFTGGVHSRHMFQILPGNQNEIIIADNFRTIAYYTTHSCDIGTKVQLKFSMPVSMLGRGSAVRVPSAAWSYCMNTRFQISRKRSQSHLPMPQSGPQAMSAPWST